MDNYDLQTLGIVALIGGTIYMLFRSPAVFAKPQATAAPQSVIFGRPSVDSVVRTIPLTSQERDSLAMLDGLVKGYIPVAAT